MLPANYPAETGALVRPDVGAAHARIRAEYRSIGPDGYAHAEAYRLVAVELLWRWIERPQEGLLALLEPGVDFEPVDLTSYGLASYPGTIGDGFS